MQDIGGKDPVRVIITNDTDLFLPKDCTLQKMGRTRSLIQQAGILQILQRAVQKSPDLILFTDPSVQKNPGSDRIDSERFRDPAVPAPNLLTPLLSDRKCHRSPFPSAAGLLTSSAAE